MTIIVNTNKDSQASAYTSSGASPVQSDFSSVFGSNRGSSGAAGSESNRHDSFESNRHSKHHQVSSNRESQSDKKQDLNDKSTAKTKLEESVGIAHSQIHTIEKSEIISPAPARSILHIADMERIISSVRSRSFGDISSVSINLKHSVMEGLEFRVSFEKGAGLTAEFIAASESVKQQIQNRIGELTILLAERGLKLTSLDVSVGGERKGNDGSRDELSPIKASTVRRTFVESVEMDISPDNTSSISYLS